MLPHTTQRSKAPSGAKVPFKGFMGGLHQKPTISPGAIKTAVSLLLLMAGIFTVIFHQEIIYLMVQSGLAHDNAFSLILPWLTILVLLMYIKLLRS